MYEIFARLLEERKIKVADVCRATGLPSSLFSEWKRGKCSPKSDKRRKIANYFGVSLEYLDTGVETTERYIKLDELLNVFDDGSATITILPYCEEYEDGLYSLKLEPWYHGIRNQKVKRIITIGGGCYKVEVCIELEGER